MRFSILPPPSGPLGLLHRTALEYLVAHPADAASHLEVERAPEVARLLSELETPARSAVLARMNADAATRALCELDRSKATATLLEVDPALAARWLAIASDEDRNELFGLLPAEAAARIRETSDYPPGTAGRLMDVGVVTFREDTTIADAFERIRQLRRRVVDVLVSDEQDRLVGIVPLQELVGAPLETKLGSVANREFVFVNAMDSRDDVVDLLTRHRLASLPVLDLDRRVLGTIRDDGLVLAAQQAVAEDLQRMVGAGKEERALSTPWLTIKSRLPWLLINLGTAFAAAFVVGLFDETIARFTALAVLLPIVAGQSGNTGAQALAVTSRGLALREIRTRHWFRVLSKEVIAAAGNGVAVAVVTAAAVALFSGSVGIAAVIGVSMVISMLMAAISGAMIPVLLTALGRDPATASSIILTTVTDIAGFFSFLGLATMFVEFLG